MTNDESNRGNVATGKRKKPPLLTYSALADFLNEGECSDNKRKAR